ncbi:unnamed protein product [Phytophthora lilii]|uniref:Unnamed protein product n=1 Tax=Phytophthora lilii TaxID=2077276 RepID=A0A9W6U686_9STRA|nr:unnamed protein product [Phytophthora lilii]
MIAAFLSKELSGVISTSKDVGASFALLLEHGYTSKSIQKLGSEVLKGVDRRSLQTLQEANSSVTDWKGLHFFLAQLNYDVCYYDEGDSWVENNRYESIICVCVPTVDNFNKKNQLASAFTSLARNINWGDVGHAFMKALSKPGDDLTSIKKTEDYRMQIALMIVDGLEGGAAQEELLQRAVAEAVQLRQESLCSSKGISLLWKWTLRSEDATTLDKMAA